MRLIGQFPLAKLDCPTMREVANIGKFRISCSERAEFCLKMMISHSSAKSWLAVRAILGRRKHLLCSALSSASIESRCSSRGS